MPTNVTFQLGDPIVVTTPSLGPTQGVFIEIQGQNLVWVAVSPTTGNPALFVTNLTGASIEKI